MASIRFQSELSQKIGDLLPRETTGATERSYNELVECFPCFEDFFNASYDFLKLKNNIDEYVMETLRDRIKNMILFFWAEMSRHKLNKKPMNNSDLCVMEQFTQVMTSAVESKGDNLREYLKTAIDNIGQQVKQEEMPMHPVLKAIIGGVIGALVGGIIFAAVGAGVTWYAAGVGAIPGFFVGLVKGFMVGSTVSTATAISMFGMSAGFATMFSIDSTINRKAVDSANKSRQMSEGLSWCYSAIPQLLTTPFVGPKK